MGEQYMWAAFAEKFHSLPAVLAALTDWQLARILMHPRDKDGILMKPDTEPAHVAPARKPTPENQLADIAALEAMGLITRENAQQVREKIQNGRQPG